MAKYLRIQKCKTEKNKHYYHVSPIGTNDYYICIDKIEKKIKFYKDSTLAISIGEMSLNSDEQFIQIPGIDYESLVITTSQANKALQRNEFPEFISKQS